MRLNSEVKAKITGIFSTVPDGVTLEWQIARDGLIEFSITQKPTSFSEEDEEQLISELNSVVFSSQECEASNRYDPVANLSSSIEIIKRAADSVNSLSKTTSNDS